MRNQPLLFTEECLMDIRRYGCPAVFSQPSLHTVKDSHLQVVRGEVRTENPGTLMVLNIMGVKWREDKKENTSSESLKFLDLQRKWSSSMV